MTDSHPHPDQRTHQRNYSPPQFKHVADQEINSDQQPSTNSSLPECLTPDQVAERTAELNKLIALMRPSVQADGGDLVLLDYNVSTGKIELQLQGACSTCAISTTTLTAGVKRILVDRLPWITEITAGVDESLDPYESAALGTGSYVPSWHP